MSSRNSGMIGKPFWNVNASQFMYPPKFQFPIIPGCSKYRFTAVDSRKEQHVFTADKPTAELSPIWEALPEGFVELRVEALDQAGNPWTLAGARTFFHVASFKGISHYPEKVREYRECALKAYRYVFDQPYIQHWLLHGTPDPEYDFNVYPSKTISSVIRAMLRYAEIDTEKKEDAVKLAVRAADFMISISYPAESPLAGLPPTYYLDFRKNLAEYNNEAAVGRYGNLMMIYPAGAGRAYLMLEKATGESRYLEAALKIAEYYQKHIQPNGSWYLFVSTETGEPTADNYCVPNVIMHFMHTLYERTGQKEWQQLEESCYAYIEKNCMELYNWEGQFEDSVFSEHYSNLAHHTACDIIGYLADNQWEDPQALTEAEELMRFVEDQFVVWEHFAPWNRRNSPKHGMDISEWFSPAGLEQYNWYLPISSSTADILRAFLKLYQVNKDPLLLEKACALGNRITTMQNTTSGMIPTHWTRKECIEDGGQLWINCQIYTAEVMLELAEVTEGLA